MEKSGKFVYTNEAKWKKREMKQMLKRKKGSSAPFAHTFFSILIMNIFLFIDIKFTV